MAVQITFASPPRTSLHVLLLMLNLVVTAQVSMRLTTAPRSPCGQLVHQVVTAPIRCPADIFPQQTCGSFTWTKLARSGGWWTQVACRT